MKHNLKIVIIMVVMFLLTQALGLYVISQYSPTTQHIVNPQTGEVKNITTYLPQNQLPAGFQPPEANETQGIGSIIISFVIAVLIILLLIKYKFKTVIKIWFLIVVIIALGISLNAILKNFTQYSTIISFSLALLLGIYKVFRPKVIIHNLTEILIYPGLAALFVPILTPLSIIILLILISIYDVWAVWKSGIMIKMAKYQMDEVGVLGGFMIPSLTKKIKTQLMKLRKSGKKKKLKIQIAILGGGDVVFPLITAGVFFRAFEIIPALFITLGSLLGLLYLFIFGEKKKPYPAMPYITTGIFISLLIWKLFF